MVGGGQLRVQFLQVSFSCSSGLNPAHGVPQKRVHSRYLIDCYVPEASLEKMNAGGVNQHVMMESFFLDPVLLDLYTIQHSVAAQLEIIVPKLQTT